MNRINQMIDRYAVAAAVSMLNADHCARDGFTEEARGYMDNALEARHELTQWIKISQAIRGWKL